MLRLSKLSDYALLIISYLNNKPAAIGARELALATNLSYHTVAKICKNLTKHGLLESARGSNGGYILVANYRSWSLLQVLEAIEGPLSLTECSLKNTVCNLQSSCHAFSPMQHINSLIIKLIADHTLESFLQLGVHNVA